MNAHQRRIAERARNLDGFKAHRSMQTEGVISVYHGARGGGKKAVEPPELIPPRPADMDKDYTRRGQFVFVEGASVRNTRTKSVATMLQFDDEQPADECRVLVHRRDNRKVWWPVAECENWNF